MDSICPTIARPATRSMGAAACRASRSKSGGILQVFVQLRTATNIFCKRQVVAVFLYRSRQHVVPLMGGIHVRQSAFRTVLVALPRVRRQCVRRGGPRPPPPPEWKFALHGFLGGSLYGEDGFAAPAPAGSSLGRRLAEDRQVLARRRHPPEPPQLLHRRAQRTGRHSARRGRGRLLRRQQLGGFGDVGVPPRPRDVRRARLGQHHRARRPGLLADRRRQHAPGPDHRGRDGVPHLGRARRFPGQLRCGRHRLALSGYLHLPPHPDGRDKLELALEVAARPGSTRRTRASAPAPTRAPAASP